MVDIQVLLQITIERVDSMNLDLYQMAVKIIGTTLPPQYEFIYAFVTIALFLILVFILVSPCVLFLRLFDGGR